MMKKSSVQIKKLIQNGLLTLCGIACVLFMHGVKYAQYVWMERTCALCQVENPPGLYLVELEKGELTKLPQYTEISAEAGEVHPFYFCGDCSRLLSDNGAVGYMIADIADGEAPRAYPLIDGAVYHIRNCEVAVALDPESHRLRISMN